MAKKRGLPPNPFPVPYPAYTPGQHLQQNEVSAQERTFYQESEQPVTSSEQPQFHAEEQGMVTTWMNSEACKESR